MKAKMTVLGLLMAMSSTVFAQATCKPFLMSVSGPDTEVIFSRLCTPNSESIMKLTVSVDGKSVSVDSATLSSTDVDVAQSINKRIREGISRQDAEIISTNVSLPLRLGDEAKAKMGLIDFILTK